MNEGVVPVREYDVIIVGAGPAGVAAAKILKENNINFCIIEKCKLPREKLCGGGLTYKSMSFINKLGLNINGIDSKDTKEVEIISKKKNKKMKLSKKIIMTDRKELDYNILKQVNVDNIFEKESVINIEENILITDKDKYKFNYIIFADGVNGYSRKLINNRKFGFCVEVDSECITDNTILDFCIVKYGYGWIFPKSTHTTIGFGKTGNEEIDYINMLNSFSEKYNLKIDKKKIKGYPIPLFSKKVFNNSVIDNKYILVGDAASLVDPVSGEGIYYAMKSGVKAAESIAVCLNKNGNLKKVYFRKTRLMCMYLCYVKLLSKLLYSRFKSFFIWLGLSNRLFIKILNIMFG